MPSSHPMQIGPIMSLILSLKPSSILDIGIGFGKYGFLCREYLEIDPARKVYTEGCGEINRRKRIDGIEIFQQYITPASKYIYDEIYIGDALPLLTEEIKEVYDLILIIDVLEHFEKNKGKQLLEIVENKSKSVLISTPKRIGRQGKVFDNEYERHISQWSENDFMNYKSKQLISDPKSLIYLIKF